MEQESKMEAPWLDPGMYLDPLREEIALVQITTGDMAR